MQYVNLKRNLVSKSVSRFTYKEKSPKHFFWSNSKPKLNIEL